MRHFSHVRVLFARLITVRYSSSRLWHGEDARTNGAIVKAVIPAAGLGTRFLPATKAVPKELLPVQGLPVIQQVVEEALAVDGVNGVVIVNSHEKPAIEQHFAKDNALEQTLESRGKDALASSVKHAAELPVSFVYQDEALGLGHAVLQAEPEMDGEPFLILLGDYFVPGHEMCRRMKAVSDEHNGASVIAVAAVPEDQVSRYGIIAGECISGDAAEEPGAVWRIKGLVEKPQPEDAPSHLFIVGRYLLSPRIMDLLATQEPGAGNEIQLTDAMVRLLDTEEMYALVVDVDEGRDTGTPAAWAGVCARAALEDPSTREAFIEALGDAAKLVR